MVTVTSNYNGLNSVYKDIVRFEKEKKIDGCSDFHFN